MLTVYLYRSNKTKQNKQKKEKKGSYVSQVVAVQWKALIVMQSIITGTEEEQKTIVLNSTIKNISTFQDQWKIYLSFARLNVWILLLVFHYNRNMSPLSCHNLHFKISFTDSINWFSLDQFHFFTPHDTEDH